MDEQPIRLHLASASPRRRAILESLGLSFTFAGVGIDEAPASGETADTMVLRLAVEKAEAAAARTSADRVVLAADTAVVESGEVFGKPADRDDARRMLMRLSGRGHEVLTGVAVLAAGVVTTALSRTFVRFRDIEPDEAALYWQSGEPADKAGAYAIQGRGGIFVAELRGSYSGVVGLPVFETGRLLERSGIPILGLNEGLSTRD